MSKKYLTGQFQAVWNAMIDGTPLTLAAISRKTGYPQQSVSARIRDFRKEEFGGHTVNRIPTTNRHEFTYALIERAA